MKKNNMIFGWIVFISLTIPMAFGMAAMQHLLIENLVNNDTFLITLANIVIVFLITLITIFIVKDKHCRHISTKKFLILALGIGFILKLTYVLLIDMTPVSDFATMWNFAIDVVQNGWPDEINFVQQQRALPYFIPLVWFFGNSSLVYEFANVVTLLACSLIVYALGRRWFGENIGRASFIISLFIPETYFNSAIPTHDIPGVLYFLVSLWLFDTIYLNYEINKRINANIVLLSIFLGFCLQLLDVQRGLASFWLLAILLFFVFHIMENHIALSEDSSKISKLKRLGGALILLIIIPFIVSKGLHTTLEHENLKINNQLNAKATANWMLGNSMTWGPVNYYYANDNYYKVYSSIESKELEQLAVNRLISDTYYNTSDRIPHYILKAQRLYQLGTQTDFYYDHNRLQPTSILKGKKIQDIFTNFNQVFIFFFELFFIAASLILIAKNAIPLRAWPALLVLAILSNVLLFLGEVQPRYIFPIYFIAPMLICALFDMLFNPKKPFLGDDELNKKKCFSGKGFLTFFVFLSVSFFTFYTYAHLSDSRLLDFTKWADYSTNYSVNDDRDFFNKIQTKYSGQKHFLLKLQHARIPQAGDIVSAKHSYPISDNNLRKFKVFVHSPYFRPESQNAINAFSVVVLINGEEKERFPIADSNTARLVEVDNILPQHGYITIELRVESHHDTKDKSWQRASLVNFENAQLMRDKKF